MAIVKRENIALRWALIRSHVPSGEGSAADLISLPVASPLPAPGIDVHASTASLNVVTQSIVRANLARAWSKSAMGYLPSEMFVRQPSNPTHNPHLWSAAHILDFLRDTLTAGFPLPPSVAAQSTRVLIADGIIPVLAAALSDAAAPDVLHFVCQFVRHAFLALLSPPDPSWGTATDLRWAPILARCVLAPLIAWASSPAHAQRKIGAEAERRAFHESLLATCKDTVECCASTMSASAPSATRTEAARCIEVCMAVQQACPSTCYRITPAAHASLSHRVPLFALLVALELPPIT
jgi:hypothetical protein